MKPGATALIVMPSFSSSARRVDQADDAGLGRGVVGLADVAGDAAIEATPTIRPFSLITPWSSSSRVIRSGAVRLTAMHRAPPVLGHVRELLVAGDAGVVHDDVDPAVLLLDVLGDPLRRVLAR